MGNALKDILGFVGGTADALLLGGTIGASKRRNQFADYLGAGQYDEAEQLALRNGEGAYAQVAQQRAAAAQKQRQQEEEALKAAQDEENTLFSGLAIALSEISDPRARQMAFEAMKPGLSQRYGLDDEDFAQVPLGDAHALRLFGQQFITPETQAQQLLTRQKQAEDARAAQAGERLRGGELAVSQGNLALGRDRLGEDRRQFDATQAATVQKTTTDATAKADALAGSLAARGQRVELISSKFDEAIAQVRGGLDGTAGRNAPFAVIPGTQAKNLDATLDTIKANIGFEELQRMRDNSPTGGALGQVTEREIAFLQAVLGSLDQGQSPDQLRANLVKAKADIIASWERVRRAYEQDFGVAYQGPGASLSVGGQQNSAPQETDVDALLKKYGVE